MVNIRHIIFEEQSDLGNSMNVYWIKPFGDFEDKYEIGEEVKVYYYPNSEDGSNENTLSHSIVFSR